MLTALETFDGAVHICAFEGTPHFVEWEQRTVDAVVGDDQTVELFE